jgi:hypothetical protein
MEHPVSSFVRYAVPFEGEPRISDVRLAAMMRCNPRIVRRHIRHHGFDHPDSGYGPMVTTRNGQGRLLAVDRARA